MKYKLTLFIIIFICSCDDGEKNSIISNDIILDDNYLINLGWDNSLPESKTSVNIKWNEWIPNDSTNFLEYKVQDVTTQNIKEITTCGPMDTTCTVNLSAGTFLDISVQAYYQNIDDSTTEFKSSQIVQFFTQPLSPVTDINIDANATEHIITWSPSSDLSLDSVFVFRTKIEENDENPNLVIDPSSGLPDEENENQWH